MEKHDFVVRFAGEGGQGVVTSAEGLAQAAAQVGYHAQTFATFPSQILGGPTWTQTRVSTSPVLSSGDELDVLVAFNEEAYNSHKDEVGETGVIIYNTGEFELKSDGTSFGMPFDELAKSTGNARAANMVVIGALAYLVNMEQSILEQFVTRRFTRGRPWRVLPDTHPFRPLSEMIASWTKESVEHADRWPDAGLAKEGLHIFEALQNDTTCDVLLATDLHAGNVLQAQREPWLVIDPKPFYGDAAYDATQHLLNCTERLRSKPKSTIGRFADLLGVDPERVRLWTFARLASASGEDRYESQTLARGLISSHAE